MQQFVKPGDIVLHSGNDLLSLAIRRVTRCPFSHVSIVIEAFDDGEFTVLDVLRKRVVHSIDKHAGDAYWHVRSPRARLEDRSQWYDFIGTPTARTRQHVVKHAIELHQHLPNSYPYAELIAYLPLFRRTKAGRWLLSRSDQMVCSAMVASAWGAMDFRWLAKNGRDVLFEIAPNWVDPGDVYRQACRDSWPLVQTKKGYESCRK